MDGLVFEDPAVDRLYPITVSRPAYAISCGSLRWIDWLKELGLPLRGKVRPHLEAIQELDFPEVQPPSDTVRGPCVLVNARVVPSRAAFEAVRQLVDQARPAIVRQAGSLVAAVIGPGTELSLAGDPTSPGPVSPAAGPSTGSSPGAIAAAVAGLDLPPADAAIPLLEYPHDVVRWHLATISDNLECRLAAGQYEEVSDGVFAARGARLGQFVVSDTRDGPILLDEDATVGPYCLLAGPAYLGPRVRVLEHAAIKDAVAIGHTSKIGGEVEASSIEPYTNKQHHGFLGHSYLGSWINLGAGTCNSDLKNTYGQVKMEYRGERISTGMQFVGCIMGDYVKTAINTGIFTGKTIGACSMMYGFVTTNVPSFVNYARLFGQVTELLPEVMVATQQRMFLRRKVEQRSCDIQLIRDMYELTRSERQLAGQPLSL